MRKTNNLVYGVGVYEKGKFGVYKNRQPAREDTLWVNMLKRCYSKISHRRNPTYIGCEVSENFKNFQYFAEWCNNQIGYNIEGYQLDKDLLSNGCSLYSEYTCVFIPREINNFLLDRANRRGKYLIGVTLHKLSGLFKSRVSVNGVEIELGYYKTEEGAFHKYKEYKESYAKELAKQYKELVDCRVIDFLNNFEVSKEV